ncbi:MAG: hypothetical protein H0V70_03190 [Ktedonobacteraceae bacterium]|nr:hypothetical protein [Ktedonobacteraceae bacterium]
MKARQLPANWIDTSSYRSSSDQNHGIIGRVDLPITLKTLPIMETIPFRGLTAVLHEAIPDRE